MRLRLLLILAAFILAACGQSRQYDDDGPNNDTAPHKV